MRLLEGYPCVESNSFEWGDQMSDVTWSSVLMDDVRAPVVEDQKWICVSCDPPPVARRDEFQGHHASACT